jgi:hypothetical protein
MGRHGTMNTSQAEMRDSFAKGAKKKGQWRSFDRLRMTVLGCGCAASVSTEGCNRPSKLALT